MRKLVIAAAAFVISATLGAGLLAIWSIVVVLIARHGSSGTGPVAGGVSGTTVIVVPLICGALGAILAVRVANRSKR
jgi:hypothetical protein